LKYVLLDEEQKFPVIVANNLLQEQEWLELLEQSEKPADSCSQDRIPATVVHSPIVFATGVSDSDFNDSIANTSNLNFCYCCWF